MAFAGAYVRWPKLLIWASLAALLLGVLNSVRMLFIPTTLWQLAVYIVMIAIGGGLMFKGLKGSGEERSPSQGNPQPPDQYNAEVLNELAELKNQINQMKTK
jgi:hypothetical protein